MQSMRATRLILLVLILILFQCSYGKIQKVHLVAHSHWDVGWLNTVANYYKYEVRYIIDNVVKLLEDNANRRFVFAEIAFIEKWWNESTNEKRDVFLRLLHNGQIEFVLGGWTMPDEALNTYPGVINTMSRGLQWIKDTFGEKYIPRTAWRIDPFGSNTAFSKMYKDMGFTNTVIMRVPHTIENQLRINKQLEFSYALEDGSTLFTTIMDIQYCVYDFFFGGAFRGSDLEGRARILNSEINTRSKGFNGDTVLIPLGCDFTWKRTDNELYQMLEETVEYMNKYPLRFQKYLKFSLVSDYMDEVNPHNTPVDGTPKYSGDFMPYSDGDEAYWTGYYSSRPELKQSIRFGESTLQLVNTFYALAYANRQASSVDQVEKTYAALQDLVIATADATHHDGITGTSKLFVVSDYMNNLQRSANLALESTFVYALKHLLTISQDEKTTFHPVKGYIPDLSNKKAVPIVLANSLSWKRTGPVELKITSTGTNVCIKDEAYKHISSFFDKNTSTVHFQAEVGALNFATYFVEECADIPKSPTTSGDILENSKVRITLCEKDKLKVICKIENKVDKTEIEVSHEMLEYHGRHEWQGQNSGAYIFVPDVVKFPQPTPLTGETSESYLQTDLYSQFEVSFSKYAKQRIRLYKDADSIEIQTTIGPLPNDREVIARFTSSNIKNDMTLYSDKNGLEMRKWTHQDDRLPHSRISKNFLPMVYSSYIQDDTNRLSIISTQSYGVSSQLQGSIEVMLHRSCSSDDHRGLSEPMYDESIYNSTIRLKLDKVVTSLENNPVIYNQKLIQETNHPIHIIPVNTELSVDEYKQKYLTKLADPKIKLGEGAQLLSLETVFNRNDNKSDPRVVMRLHNIAQEDIVVDIQSFTELFHFNSTIETSLATQDVLKVCSVSDLQKVTLRKNQIRTFVVTNYALPQPSTSSGGTIIEDASQSSSGKSFLFLFAAFVTVVVIALIIAAGAFSLQPRKSEEPHNNASQRSRDTNEEDEELGVFDDESA